MSYPPLLLSSSRSLSSILLPISSNLLSFSLPLFLYFFQCILLLFSFSVLLCLYSFLLLILFSSQCPIETTFLLIPPPLPNFLTSPILLSSCLPFSLAHFAFSSPLPLPPPNLLHLLFISSTLSKSRLLLFSSSPSSYPILLLLSYYHPILSSSSYPIILSFSSYPPLLSSSSYPPILSLSSSLYAPKLLACSNTRVHDHHCEVQAVQDVAMTSQQLETGRRLASNCLHQPGKSRCLMEIDR